MTTPLRGPEALTALLHELECALIEAGAQALVDFLAPPATAAEIDDAFGALGIPIHPEIMAWFSWHNGYRPWSEGMVLTSGMPSYYPLTLGQMTALYRGMPLGSEVWQWPPTAVPLASSGGLPLFAVDVPDDKTLRAFFFDASGDFMPPTKTYDSLCAPVQRWIDEARSGDYVWHPEVWKWDFGSVRR